MYAPAAAADHRIRYRGPVASVSVGERAGRRFPIVRLTRLTKRWSIRITEQVVQRARTLPRGFAVRS